VEARGSYKLRTAQVLTWEIGYSTLYVSHRRRRNLDHNFSTPSLYLRQMRITYMVKVVFLVQHPGTGFRRRCSTFLLHCLLETCSSGPVALVPVRYTRQVSVSVLSAVPRFRMSGSNAHTEAEGYGGGTSALCSNVSARLHLPHAGRQGIHASVGERIPNLLAPNKVLNNGTFEDCA
jgi:hypothetical protein